MKFLLTILMVLFSLFSYAESTYSSYFLKGRITDKNNRPVANTRFTLIGTNPICHFFTNSNGEYFVEAIYYIPCLSGGWDPADRKGIRKVKEANGELLIITCEKGSAKVKFNWEKYYSNDIFHTPLTSSRSCKATDIIDVILTDAPIPPATISRNELLDEWISNFKRELKLLLEIPIDSFTKAGKIKRDEGKSLFILPDGRTTRFEDAYSDKELPVLMRCYWGRGTMNGFLNQSFETTEVRNIHVDSLFTEDLLGNYSKLYILRKVGSNQYDLTNVGFDKRYGCFTFYTNNKGYIEDVSESFDSNYYFN